MGWIKRKQNVLRKVAEQEKWEAEQKAEEDRIRAEKEEYERVYGKPRKYQPQIDVCEQLITALNTLKPKSHEEEADQSGNKYNEADVEAKLTSGDWKKEKVHVLKKPVEEQGVQPGGSKKKRSKQNKPKDKPEDTKLTLTIDTLGYFDQIKVVPPSYGKEIDGTIKQLTEKRDYFVKMSDDLNEGKTTAEPTEAKEGGDNAETEDKPAKKEKEPKKKAVKMDDEDMFPSL